ncbi:MAG: O-antigen ligase family protein [Gaiellaceae bacterium]
MTILACTAGVAGCLAVALLFVARDHRLRLAALATVGASSCALGAVTAFTSQPAYVAVVASLIVSAALLGPLALTRWPWSLAFVTLLLIPVRIPVEVAGSRANLLLPLYMVAIAAGATIFLETLRGDRRSRELGPLALPFAGFVLWIGISLCWSRDVDSGALQILAYFLPFSMIAAGLARLPWSRRAVIWLALQLIAMALLFTAVGYEQYRTRNVFWNPKVIIGDAYAPFYRVNSVFWDPSIYGRFLVVAMLVALVVVVRGRSFPNALAATAAIAAICVGLVLSYSQSSFSGLIVGVLLITAIAWRRRAILGLAAVALVLLSIGAASPNIRHNVLTKSVNGLDRSTSGRASLVSNGIRIAVDHPVFGVGLSGFRREYAKLAHLRGKAPKKAASHTTPITVAAEGGVIGLALYGWLLAALFLTVFRRLGRGFEHDVSLAIGLAAGAIVVHSLSYANFFEDPTIWALFGLAPLVARARAEVPAAGLAEVAAREIGVLPTPEPERVASG